MSDKASYQPGTTVPAVGLDGCNGWLRYVDCNFGEGGKQNKGKEKTCSAYLLFLGIYFIALYFWLLVLFSSFLLRERDRPWLTDFGSLIYHTNHSSIPGWIYQGILFYSPSRGNGITSHWDFLLFGF